ncbi:DUF1345 domain-containing protein [Hymenobacter taeanensis]|uniref:DUF1345 domain-containing protein n=1 Tax=Hymenobacter taeanensis TaxID=2735321 RepID=A0A6M6BDP3_9BACT|nr:MULTISPECIES: DUF1345 domain-containing protein [Hymenobacter]QJX46356.1 DUF1345 domain-containing protein [Hymenobacter taeanensis]UOQ80217.1 DUF1345 domain-containing protein [Hymenobacter sp. 5414T-23]
MATSAPARSSRGFHRLTRLATWKRLSLGALPALLLYWLLPGAWPLMLRLLAAWDGFAVSTLLITWAIILTANVGHLRSFATREDPGRVLSFAVVLTAATASLIAVVLLLSSMRQGPAPLLVMHILIGSLSVLMAWLLVHTLFTLRYAHLFYNATSNGRQEGGLEFPGSEPEPDYLDFAYFAFVIGMTAQTADVSISDRGIRRLALLHGLLSFGFNTAVVALTISGLAGLL